MNIDNHKLVEESISKISQLIRRKHGESLRFFNEVLLRLFWQIGNTLNKHSEKDIIILSNLMVKHFGDLFQIENLHNMQALAKCIPEATLLEISTFISWEHVPELVKFKKIDEWKYYTSQIFEYSLTGFQLKSLIDKSEWKPTKSTEINSDFFLRMHTILYHEPDKGKSLIKDNFDQTKLSRYLFLFEQKPINQSIDGENETPLLNSISNLISNFQFNNNDWLNTSLAFLYWDLGKQLTNSSILDFEHSKNAFRELFEFLTREFKGFFTLQKLQNAINFYKKFPYEDEKVELIFNVSWEQIIILLNFDDQNLINYYISEIIQNNLTLDDLNKLITQPIPEIKEGASSFQTENPSVEDINYKFGSQVLRLNVRTVGHSQHVKSILSSNILKNTEFVAFMKSM